VPRKTGIMVDLETLGLKADTKVIQVGMVSFDETYTPINTFCMNVDPEQQEERTITKSTLEFWAEQPKAVRKSVLKDPVAPDIVAQCIIEFIEGVEGEPVFWCNHVLFDANIVHSFLKMYSDRELIDDVVKFYNIEDYATIRNNVGAKFGGGHYAFKEYCMESYLKESGVTEHLVHNALDDCLFQLHSLKLIMEALGGTDE